MRRHLYFDFTNNCCICFCDNPKSHDNIICRFVVKNTLLFNHPTGCNVNFNCTPVKKNLNITVIDVTKIKYHKKILTGWL